MDRVETCEEPLHPFVSARAGATAFDAESVTLADGMEIREVSDAPRAHGIGILGHGLKTAQRAHDGVSDAPYERSKGKVARHDDNGHKRRPLSAIARPLRKATRGGRFAEVGPEIGDGESEFEP